MKKRLVKLAGLLILLIGIAGFAVNSYAHGSSDNDDHHRGDRHGGYGHCWDE